MHPAWGTIAASDEVGASAAPEAALAFAPTTTFTKAQYGSGGVGLRNLGTGTLHVSGVTLPVKAAFLYWAVITTGPAKAPDTAPTFKQSFPAGRTGVTLTGVLLGTGSSPCWPGNTISVFRAPVPVAQVGGNGSYQVSFAKAGASGSTKGEDPWVTSPLPSLEGASLVVVGTGTGTVYLFDKGLAGWTFGKRTNPELFSYALNLPTAAGAQQVLWEQIGADGQIGHSRTAGNTSPDQPLLAAKATLVNKQVVAGPYQGGSEIDVDYDSDWNGNAAAPLPRLWDDVGHDITAVARGLKSIPIEFQTQGDCLTPVANVIASF